MSNSTLFGGIIWGFQGLICHLTQKSEVLAARRHLECGAMSCRLRAAAGGSPEVRTLNVASYFCLA